MPAAMNHSALSPETTAGAKNHESTTPVSFSPALTTPSRRKTMTGTDENELLDANQIHEEFGLSPSRLSELYRDRETTTFPEPDSTEGRRRWKRGTIGPFLLAYRKAKAGQSAVRPSLLEGPRDELMSTSDVAKALGHKRTVTLLAWLRDKPGYFPEPDVAETTEGGRQRRQWYRGTIRDWVDQRPGPGNTQSKSRPQTPIRVADGNDEDLLDSKQAAPLLGYSSHLELNRAVARGMLPELTDPDEVVRSDRGLTSSRWARRRVTALARARQDAPSSAQLTEQRLSAVREALRATTDHNRVTVETLAQAHPGHGSAAAWKRTIDEVRHELGQVD